MMACFRAVAMGCVCLGGGSTLFGSGESRAEALGALAVGVQVAASWSARRVEKWVAGSAVGVVSCGGQLACCHPHVRGHPCVSSVMDCCSAHSNCPEAFCRSEKCPFLPSGLLSYFFFLDCSCLRLFKKQANFSENRSVWLTQTALSHGTALM